MLYVYNEQVYLKNSFSQPKLFINPGTSAGCPHRNVVFPKNDIVPHKHSTVSRNVSIHTENDPKVVATMWCMYAALYCCHKNTPKTVKMMWSITPTCEQEKKKIRKMKTTPRMSHLCHIKLLLTTVSAKTRP